MASAHQQRIDKITAPLAEGDRQRANNGAHAFKDNRSNTALRTSGYDILPDPPKVKPPEPFNVDASRIPILDHKHQVRGHIGPGATEACLPRFGLNHGGKLQKVQGRDCWVGRPPRGGQP